jgi:Zn-finger nucleic acid-binding protein
VQAYVSIDKIVTCRQVVLDRYLDRQEAEQVVCKEGEKKCNVYRRADRAEDNKEVEEASKSSKNSKNSSSNKEEIDTVKVEGDKAQQVFKQ